MICASVAQRSRAIRARRRPRVAVPASAIDDRPRGRRRRRSRRGATTDGRRDARGARGTSTASSRARPRRRAARGPARARTSRRAACRSRSSPSARGGGPVASAEELGGSVSLGRSAVARSPPNDRSVTPAGHTESASRQRHERHEEPELGRAQVERRVAPPSSRARWCSTAEISAEHVHRGEHDRRPRRRRAQPQPLSKTPARIRNSPANVAEPGTASAMTPWSCSIVASAGRPRAIPPSSRNSPVAVRRSIQPGEQEQRRRDQAVVDHLRGRRRRSRGR